MSAGRAKIDLGLPRTDGSAGEAFFDLAAKYCIAPGASLGDLFNDCDCLLESGVGGLEEAGCDAFTNAQWASLYVLRQAKGIFAEIYRRVSAGECIEEGCNMKPTFDKSVEHYGAGCKAGCARAASWLADPMRGDPRAGGTLSKHVLALAEMMCDTNTEAEVERVRSEIVGFCYTIECPEHAAACQAAASRRDAAAA